MALTLHVLQIISVSESADLAVGVGGTRVLRGLDKGKPTSIMAFSCAF